MLHVIYTNIPFVLANVLYIGRSEEYHKIMLN
jgi:hypothetical protein